MIIWRQEQLLQQCMDDVYLFPGRDYIVDKSIIRPKFYKAFLMHNSTEHERYHYNKCKMLTIFGILTFISIINTTSESFKARKYFF